MSDKPENRKKTGKHILPEAAKPHQFKPGQSGNPGGRPKKQPITDRYKALLEEPLPEKFRAATQLPEGATFGDAIAKAQILKAIGLGKAYTDAAREIREAIEGKSTQRIKIDDFEANLSVDARDLTDRLAELTEQIRIRARHARRESTLPESS